MLINLSLDNKNQQITKVAFSQLKALQRDNNQAQRNTQSPPHLVTPQTGGFAMVSAIVRGCALQGFHCGPGVPITFGAVGAGGANAAVPALGHAPTAAEAALALH